MPKRGERDRAERLPGEPGAADPRPIDPRPCVAGAGEVAPPEEGDEFAGYADALEYLQGRINLERSRPGKIDPKVYQFERTRALMSALGDPQTSFRSVHVAGSKGKGSVCEMLAGALEGCGYTTGLYTSPHLVDLRERVRINRRMIDEQAFADALSRAARAARKVRRKHGECTYFELLTAAAFCHFAEMAVDIAIVEVGLGGRLDCTNVVVPEVAIISAIQLEHADMLGPTLAHIAREKAGIIKPGIPCVTLPQQDEAIIEVFAEVASRQRAPLLVLGRDVEFTSRFAHSPEHGHHCKVSVTTDHLSLEHVVVPFKGDHQAWNAGLVLAALDQLSRKGFSIDEAGVAEGFSRTRALGRCEVVHDHPRILIDGAHTPESIEALIRTLGTHLRYDSLVLVFGCSSDKDVVGMLGKVARGADKVIFTKAADTLRAVEPRELQKRYVELGGKMCQVAPSVRDALKLASLAVTRDDIVCVCGSFYVAGEAKRLLQEKRGAPAPELREPKPPAGGREKPPPRPSSGRERLS